MRTSATPQTDLPCPQCAAALVSGAGACGSCALPLTGPVAARLWVVDQQIHTLRRERVDLLNQLRSLPPDAATHAAAEIPTRHRLAGWSGQQLLLGAGVVLTLVASVIFLAVAWTFLGVAGQVTIMLAATAATAAGSGRLARRGLRATAEAVAMLTVGMATVNVAAARHLDLVGLAGVDASAYLAVSATVLAAVFSGLSRRVRALSTYQVAGVLAAALVTPAALVAVDAGVTTVVAALLLSGAGFAAAAVTVPAPWTVARVAAAGVSGCYVAVGSAVAVPTIFGAPLVGAGGTCALLTAGAAGALVALPARRTGTAAVAARVVGAVLASAAIVAVADHAAPVVLVGVAVLCAGLVAASVDVPARAWRFCSHVSVPAMVAAHATAAGAALTVAWHASADGTSQLLVAGAAAAAAAAGGLTSTVAGDVRAPAAGYAGLATLVTAAAATSNGGLVALAVALLTASAALVAVAAWRRGHAEEVALAVAAAAGAGATLLLAADAEHPDVAAAAFAVTGLAALAYAALPGRGLAAYAGVLSCSAATWTISAQQPVQVLEMYTLPLVGLALIVGLVRLRREPAAPSWATLGPAMSAALVPSAFAAVGDTGLTRPLAVLAIGVAAAAAGGWWRWQAPLVTGVVAVLVVAASQLAPYAVGMPRWATLAAAGITLLAVGARYEKRQQQAQAAYRWVAALR